MATSSQATDAVLALDTLPVVSSDVADRSVCILFCVAMLLGTAWFYWHVMYSAQRATSRGEAPDAAVAAQQRAERGMFLAQPNRLSQLA